MLSKNQKYFAIAGVLILATILILFIYRVFFQFDNKKVSAYIQAEANKYADKVSAYRVLHEAVMFVLQNRSLTNQVLTVAKDSKVDKERILVDSAINQCKILGYIPETRYQIAS